MFSIENFEERPIKKDGNCLFRAVSTFIEPSLQTCRRTRDGRPTNKNYEFLENTVCENLRSLVTTFMTLHSEKFQSALHYDDDFYDSIEDRISVISHNGEYAGNLELFVLSNMFKIQINTFVRFNEDSKNYSSKYNLISKIGNYSKMCNLLLHDNHYSMLKVKPDFNMQFAAQLIEWAEENPEVIFNGVELSDGENDNDSEFELLEAD
jgi:hypothetical protein